MSKCFIVLSMHRSASSLVAQALGTYSNWYINDTKPGFGQPHGNYENLEMRHLNDAILEAAGGSWRRPPSQRDILAQEPAFRARILKVLGLLKGDRKVWGWKDPRSIFTLSLMLPHIKNYHLVCLFREPGKAARSMSTRDAARYGINLNEAKQLTRKYNKALLRVIRKYAVEPTEGW